MTTTRTAVNSDTFYWWPVENNAVSPSDLNTVLVQLVAEHSVQVIHTTVDGETKGFNVNYILYTICIQWTGGDVVNCLCYFRG
jgi:hypothetical protein